MPRVYVRDTSTGEGFSLDSSNADMIAPWLLETINRIRPSELTPAQVQIRPLWIEDPTDPSGSRPDWSTDGVRHAHVYLVSSQGSEALRELAKGLHEAADKYDAEDEARKRPEQEPLEAVLESPSA